MTLLTLYSLHAITMFCVRKRHRFLSPAFSLSKYTFRIHFQNTDADVIGNQNWYHAANNLFFAKKNRSFFQIKTLKNCYPTRTIFFRRNDRCFRRTPLIGHYAFATQKQTSGNWWLYTDCFFDLFGSSYNGDRGNKALFREERGGRMAMGENVYGGKLRKSRWASEAEKSRTEQSRA